MTTYGRRTVFPIPENAHYLNLRQDWLGILDGDRSAALVLDVLAGWAASILDSPKYAGQPVPASVNIGRRSLQHIEQYLFGSIRERAIKLAIAKLKEQGFIETKTAIARNSEFIVHIQEINIASKRWSESQLESPTQAENASIAGKNCLRTQAENASIAGKNCPTSYIPKDLSKESDLKSEPSLAEKSKSESSDPVTDDSLNSSTENNGNTDKPERVAEDKYSAAPPQNEFEIESKQWLCHKAPWHKTATTYTDEMLEAVFQGDRTFWGLENGKRNDTKISQHLRKQERFSQEYNGRPDIEATALGSRQLLLDYWNTAVAIARARNRVQQQEQHQPAGEFSPPPAHVLEQFKKLGKRHAS